MDDLEARIAAAESRMVIIDAEIAENSSAIATVATLTEELGTLTDRLERDVERWGALAGRDQTA